MSPAEAFAVHKALARVQEELREMASRYTVAPVVVAAAEAYANRAALLLLEELRNEGAIK